MLYTLAESKVDDSENSKPPRGSTLAEAIDADPRTSL
jgi:hypothetical protein